MTSLGGSTLTHFFDWTVEFLELDMRLMGRNIAQPGNVIGHELHGQHVPFPGAFFPPPERLDEASAAHVDGHARVNHRAFR